MAGTNFEKFFGKIPKSFPTHKDEYSHETHNLPEAYLGKNRFLMGTFDYLITKEGREFLTKVILPFEHTDNLNISWEVFHFDKTIADIEPEQGMPRYVTQQHDMYSDTLTRRGLAFIIEHGFYTTDIGKQHYLMNIQQIVDAVSDTCAYQVIRALLDCEDYYGGTSIHADPKNVIRQQLSRFGLVQRGEHGMHILDSDLKDAMNREGVRPNTYIFPARMSSYIRMRDPYMTEHSRGGVGVANLGEDPSALTFRGTRVYECRYFETDYIEAPFDPLEQVITYGEYYTCAGTSEQLYVFDMDTDNWVEISKRPIVYSALAKPSTASSPVITGGSSTPGRPFVSNATDADNSYVVTNPKESARWVTEAFAGSGDFDVFKAAVASSQSLTPTAAAAPAVGDYNAHYDSIVQAEMTNLSYSETPIVTPDGSGLRWYNRTDDNADTRQIPDDGGILRNVIPVSDFNIIHKASTNIFTDGDEPEVSSLPEKTIHMDARGVPFVTIGGGGQNCVMIPLSAWKRELDAGTTEQLPPISTVYEALSDHRLTAWDTVKDRIQAIRKFKYGDADTFVNPTIHDLWHERVQWYKIWKTPLLDTTAKDALGTLFEVKADGSAFLFPKYDITDDFIDTVFTSDGPGKILRTAVATALDDSGKKKTFTMGNIDKMVMNRYGATGTTDYDKDSLRSKDVFTLTEDMFNKGQFRRFKEKKYSSFHEAHFAPHTSEVQSAVAKELVGCIDAGQVIRPKLLSGLFVKHTK